MRDKKEIYLGGRGGEEELGGIVGAEPYQDVLCEKTIFSIKEKSEAGGGGETF